MKSLYIDEEVIIRKVLEKGGEKMNEKHRVRINVGSCNNPVIESKKKTVRSRALDFIFGHQVGVFVLVPGGSVESVEIHEINRGGKNYGEI